MANMNENIDVLKIQKKIVEEVAKKLNTTLNALDEDVIRLEEWLNTQPHLPKLLDSYSLRNFLILNKGSVQVTKQKIDNYYTNRSKMTDFFSDINPRNAYHKDLNNMVYITLYPGLTDDLYKVCYFKVKNENQMDGSEPSDWVKKIFTIEEMRLREDIIFGDILVADLQQIPLSSLLKITPTLIYKCIAILYEVIAETK